MGRPSEVGKVELGPYIHTKDDSSSINDYTSSLNSSPNLKNQAGRPLDARGQHITTRSTLRLSTVIRSGELGHGIVDAVFPIGFISEISPTYL